MAARRAVFPTSSRRRSVLWSLGASLTQPIFKGGQLVHQRRAAVAAAQEALANYKATVLTAFQNVSDALYALHADADALAAQTLAATLGSGQPVVGTGAIQERRGQLFAGPDLAAKLSDRRHRPGEGARAALRRHGGAVSGARRRLVESCRRRGQFNALREGAIVSTVESGSAADGGKIAPRRAMVKPLVIMAIAVALILGGIFGWQSFMAKMMSKYMGAAATAPQTVSTITAAEDQWQSRLQATGSLRAVRGADLSSQASGIVDEIHFDSGNDVPAGKVLLRLRPLDDYALLQQLEAAAALAEQNYKRDQEQFAAQAISQAVIDGDVATLKTARAQVAAQQALDPGKNRQRRLLLAAWESGRWIWVSIWPREPPLSRCKRSTPSSSTSICRNRRCRN